MHWSSVPVFVRWSVTGAAVRWCVAFAGEEFPHGMNEDRIVGCILGTAVGDAIGLPYEGLSRRRAEKLLGRPDRHRFFFGCGMVSDDTEHTCIVAQSLIAACGDLSAFRRSFAWGLRRWLLDIPAGIGITTLRSILRLWVGFGPERSGVYSSGHGPAMRAAILGVTIDDTTALCDFVGVSSRITHTDPKAEIGALAVALGAQMAGQHGEASANEYLARLASVLDDRGREFLTLIADVVRSVNARQSTAAFADSMGLAKGVSCYIYHSVPVALHAWLSYPQDCRAAIESVVACGGNTDSTGAIVGGIVGASVGRSGIPDDWLSGLIEWPRTVRWMEQLGAELANITEANSPSRIPRLPVMGILARNLFFLVIVLYHGFRRLAPPY
jgi:ADP-ribosylglycohydrolase